jgi:predicted transcriptional regulator
MFCSFIGQISDNMVCTVAAVENSDTKVSERQTFSFVNSIESDVSQNVTQTLSTLISLAMALILKMAFQKLRAILT